MHTVQSTDGTTIGYDISGTGPALILVGGAFQHRAIDPPTAALAGLLARDFTVIHYDRRGRGDSGDTPRSPEREIEDLAALLKEAWDRHSCSGTLLVRCSPWTLQPEDWAFPRSPSTRRR